MTFHYRIFELLLDSDLPLPELSPLQADGEADVIIREGEVAEAPATAAAHGPFFRSRGEQAWFFMPAIGNFLMEHGRTLYYQPLDRARTDELRLYLLGTCMAVLLFQRRTLVLHGNAIAINGHAVICAGRSGAGKSTLAAAFLRRGYAVLTDDTCVLAADNTVLPGFARIKLWQDSADKLGVETAQLQRIRPELDKFQLPLRAGFHEGALPASHIYVLRPDRGATFSLEAYSGATRLRPLQHHTYRQHFLEAMGLRAWHLQRLGQLASAVPISALRRPLGHFEPDALVDFILADLAGPR